MDRIKYALFTRSSGIRHLIMLAITPLVIAWCYVSIALLRNDWNWLYNHSVAASTVGIVIAYCGIIGIAIGLSAIMAAIIYWNGRLWMLKFLLKSLASIPFLGRAFALMADDDDAHFEYDDINDTWDYVGGGIPFPFSIIISIVVSAVKCVFNLIIAIGIPLISPLPVFMGLGYITELARGSYFAVFGIGLLMFLATVFMFIVHPILSFKYD